MAQRKTISGKYIRKDVLRVSRSSRDGDESSGKLLISHDTALTTQRDDVKKSNQSSYHPSP